LSHHNLNCNEKISLLHGFVLHRLFWFQPAITGKP
jgi:hypothetical protein